MLENMFQKIKRYRFALCRNMCSKVHRSRDKLCQNTVIVGNRVSLYVHKEGEAREYVERGESLTISWAWWAKR